LISHQDQAAKEPWKENQNAFNNRSPRLRILISNNKKSWFAGVLALKWYADEHHIRVQIVLITRRRKKTSPRDYLKDGTNS
jgi:hypothetical protein